jgi:polyisoprenyl-teichoic acid--peptidoglycan teichoic acid transferase
MPGALPPDLIPAEPPRRGWWMTKRFLLAAIGIVLLSGGASATLALNEVGKLVEALGESKAVKIAPKLLAPTSKGAPETLLLVGNDQRPAPKGNPNGFVIPHSNEMLLVRINPSKPTISMLSIPRELQVTIYPPGAAPVVNRINAAYGIGGAQLMTETIKRVLGVSVNHVFVLTFPKFRRAVNELGCVYMGVDRRYYHVNEPGGEQYFEINLQPGYQRLCGSEALEFVANRHEDTSLIRDARDQRFLLEAKTQYGPTLFENREKFERILGRTVETDLHGTSPVLDLLELLVESAGKPVRQVPFQVNLLRTYDTASEQQIHESVRAFLGGTAPIRKQKLHAAHAAPHGHHAVQHNSSAGLILTPTTTSELDHARSQAPSLPFALEYPRARDSYAGAEPDTLRLYDIRDQQGHIRPIYAIVIDRGQLGQFYDVQGTTWADPPLLSGPSQTVHIGRRTYEVFYAGEQIKAIAWREAGAVYWIENTLTNNVSPRTMLAMAEQTLPVVHAGNAGVPLLAASPRGFNLPPRTTAATSLTSQIGAALGFAGLAVVALLALLVFNRQRELSMLREQVVHALTLEARQRPLLATAGILGPEQTPTSTPLAQQPSTRAPPAEGASTEIPDAERVPTIYRAPRRRHIGVLAAAGVAIVGILIALGVHLLHARSLSSTPADSPVPVAVFNATSSPGAARRIADTLRAGHIHVGAIGNINASLGHGAYVLYPSGAQAQAQRVARLLSGLSPTVTPIQPQVENVVGRHNEIVVVLD